MEIIGTDYTSFRKNTQLFKKKKEKRKKERKKENPNHVITLCLANSKK